MFMLEKKDPKSSIYASTLRNKEKKTKLNSKVAEGKKIKKQK